MLSLAFLSGGRSGRMGQDKALIPFLGRPLIMRILERLASVADEVLVSTNQPEDYAFLGLTLFPDLLPNCGPLGGLFSALSAAHHPLVAAVACDMPFASPTLFKFEAELLSETGADVVIPATPLGMEPLHAVYRRDTCLPVIQSALKAGRLKLVGWLPMVMVRIVQPDELAHFDPHGLAFWNLNTPDEFKQAENRARLDIN